MVVRRTDYGVGVVVLNGFGVWSLWVRGDGVWNVRMSLDDFAAIRIHEYQRVRLKLPLEDEVYVYFRGRRENPPFVWLEFGFDVRPRSGTAKLALTDAVDVFAQ
jgi:hypothetical protein